MLKSTTISNDELVRQFKEGNDDSIRLLVKRWHKVFCQKAYWIVKDADLAKDIAQESWKIIIGRMNQLKDAERFEAWAMRIVYHKALDSLNNSKKEAANKELYAREQIINSGKKVDEEELKRKLLVGINSLPTDQQSTLKLFYLEGLKLKEIGTLLHISEGTVKSRLYHAREKLKQLIKL